MSAKMQSKFNLPVLSVMAACLAFAATLNAQVQTQSSTATQAPSVTTTVERGEVVYAQGNEVVVKMEDGSLRDFQNVSNSVKVNVDGKMLGVHDLKPGMKLQRTITTTTTPKLITTTQTVSGKVWHVNAPSTVILTLDDGTNQEFKVPKGQTFMINGKQTDVFGLRKGMKVSATKIVEVPATDVSTQRQLAGTMPPPPPADAPILIAVVHPAPAPAPAASAAAAAPAALPKTGSPLPLMWLMGLLCIGASFGLKAIRARS